MTARPRSVRLRVYDVGSGDCLLLTVGYGSALPDGRRYRHMLVDCGSVRPAKGGPSLAEVAAMVADHCDGRLDVVVSTHRHPGRVDGFADPVVRDVLRPLEPDVVVRPWTDAPDADSPQLVALLDASATAGGTALVAAPLLDDWGRDGRARYVRAGDTVDLDETMPRVSVRVLGPASGERLSDSARPGGQFLALAVEGGLAPLLARPSGSWADALRVLAEPGGIGAAEWLLRTLNTRTVDQELEIAQAFDDLVHDTSVALLVTVGSRSLLLPGDARAASWAPIVDGGATDARFARRVADVDVLAVGRHGARSATPRRLRDLWRPRIGSAHPLVSVLSNGRGLPDNALVADLENLGPLHRTDALPEGVWWMDVEAATSGREPFAFTVGPEVG